MKCGLVELKQKPKRINNVFELISEKARGKTVLNVGSAGGVQGYLPGNGENWLHEQLNRVALELVGIDIDQKAITYAMSHGVTIQYENCEDMKLGRKFDLIVMSDVIEHMDGPVHGIRNLMNHLDSNGELLITTPNMSGMSVVGKAVLNMQCNVLSDHVCGYLPEHMQAICDRYGFHISETYWFDHIDKQSAGHFVKSIIFRFVSHLIPRLSNSFLVVFKNS